MARNPNDIRAYRKKRERRNRLYMMLSMTLLVFGIFFIWTSGDPFEWLRGIARSVNRAESGQGFPVQLSGSAGYTMSEFGSGFTLLSDTYLYTYSERGGRTLAFRHNYSRAIQRTTDRRTLIYNFNGNDFSVFDRTRRIYENSTDDRIVLAELGNNDFVAIVTTSTTFANVLQVYDASGNWRYTRRFIDEDINAVTFTSRANEILVAVSTVQEGVAVSKVYRLRTDSEDDVIWESEWFPDSMFIYLVERNNLVSVLADNMMLVLNTNTGGNEGWFEFSTGQLKHPVFGDNFHLVELADYVTGRTLYVTLDER